jgi:hypothetical protein
MQIVGCGKAAISWPDGLLVEVRVVGMVMMMVVVMRVSGHHNLRQCHGGHCEAEEKSKAEPEFFHTLLWRADGRSAEQP